MENKKIKVCPECGKHWEVYCFHDYVHVRTVETPIQQAIDLLEGTILEIKNNLEVAEYDLETYKGTIRE